MKPTTITLHTQFQMLAAVSNPEPVGAGDLPESLRARFVSDKGDWLLRVYPTTQIWDEEPLRNFVNDVRMVDSEITGTPLQNYEAAREIQTSYYTAALYALSIIVVVECKRVSDEPRARPLDGVHLFSPGGLEVRIVHGGPQTVHVLDTGLVLHRPTGERAHAGPVVVEFAMSASSADGRPPVIPKS